MTLQYPCLVCGDFANFRTMIYLDNKGYVHKKCISKCRVCGHLKSEHKGHVAPDWTGQKINHISCRVTVKTDYIEDFLYKGNTMPIGHSCSCHGFKPNTSLKQAIKKYQKFLKTLPKTSDNLYRIKEVQSAIRRFRKSIKENPDNLLHWQKKEVLASQK